MTFEKFKKEVARGIYDISEIAYMANDVELLENKKTNEIVIAALTYFRSIDEAEDNFKNFLKSKGINTDD